MNTKLYFYRVLTWHGQNSEATWQSMRTPCVIDMYICARVSACACVINENKHPFQDFRYLINDIALIYPPNHYNFCHVGLFLFFYNAKVTWYDEKCSIRWLNQRRRSSLTASRLLATATHSH